MIKALRIFLMMIPLIFGSFIYIIFRSEKLLMFRWFQFLNLNDFIQSMRSLKASLVFPAWFLYNLPDGLWIFSYVLISIEIWNRKITFQNIFWISIIPLIAIISEILQFFNLLRGTFDVFDFLFYILGTIIPLLFYDNLTLIKIKNYEKS